MPIAIKMPALSPTMEEGTLAKWLVGVGDTVTPGDIIGEIETDKATMEFEAVDEGRIATLLVAQGTDGVQVGTVIATLETAEGTQDDARAEPASPAASLEQASPRSLQTKVKPLTIGPQSDRHHASPLARRIAAETGVDLATLTGSGPNGRIVKADVARRSSFAAAVPAASPGSNTVPTSATVAIPDVPHSLAKLGNMRRTIARRLTESKQQVPHIYLTVDVRLDALLALRADLNAASATRDVKLSVNDLMIKALAVALMQVPQCNVMFTPDQLISFARADIAVAVSTSDGLITPIVTGADSASLSSISMRMKDLAARARDRKLKPEEFTGGTASLSNLGMYGIKQFGAVINPPQATIMAVGASERRPWILDGDRLGIAQVMGATGSFDHRAIDGADGAALMQAFKASIEAPFGLL
jgi:pyruvate dehydrogenase E2 component (dihydrolipoamide acetyltransferase)